MQLPKRYPRIERDSPVEVFEDENAHLWALSYSDFLMALLSFFILFFSIDEQEHNKLFLQLTKEFSEMTQKNSGNSDKGTARGLSSQNSDKKLNVISLQNVLKDFNVETKVDENTFVVDFPKDFFKNGDYKIISNNKEIVTAVLEKLKPFEGSIKIYFEGHTDDLPSRKKVENLVVDNFLLSSLRAATALQVAKEVGFEEKNMYVQAASSHKRNTRSLSMHIVVENEVRK